MATSQLEQAMATLRLSLAEIRNKEDQMDDLVNQFQTQRSEERRVGKDWRTRWSPYR